jgi:hypothetical protein
MPLRQQNCNRGDRVLRGQLAPITDGIKCKGAPGQPAPDSQELPDSDLPISASLSKNILLCFEQKVAGVHGEGSLSP